MRKAQKKKVAAAAFLAVITTISFILLSSGNTQKEIRVTQEFREYNYDVMKVLQRFGRLAKEKNIVICVIEPHILFSIISEEQQRRLLQRTGFNFSAKIRNVVTVAVQGKSAWKLSQNVIKTDFESAGFSYFGERKNQDTAFSRSQNKSNLSSHHFYVRHHVIIHVVVFYQKARYFWHGKLKDPPIEISQDLPRGLLFSKSDSIYDRFHVVPMPANESLQGLHVPDNTEHFLSQIPTSRWIRCQPRKARKTEDSQNVSSESIAPREVFERTADSVVAEIKAIMDARMIPFWLASGTLLGWYRNCGIIPHTNDMDFATWSSDLNEILANDFQQSTQLHLISVLGQSDEDLEFWLIHKWLRVDLFFTYQNDNHFWVGGHNLRHGYSFRYLFPKFSLCSGDFLGHKVLVPCEVEKVLKAEYGSEWMTPVISWNYEESARNVMGRRYWNKKEASEFISQISTFH